MIIINRYGWPSALILLVLLLAATLYVYSDTLIYLLDRWNDFKEGEYGHGYLVLGISAYMIFGRKELLATLQPGWSLLGFLALVFFSIGWTLSYLLDIQSAMALLLLFVIMSAVWTLLGTRVFRHLALPLSFIVFALPVWSPISPVLQDVTADVVFYFIRLLEVPAYREANNIVVPSGILSIEEACSGLRYFMAALTLGVLYGYMNYTSVKARLAVVLIAALAAIVANFIRVFIVVYLGWSTDMQHEWVHDHLYLGWYIFAALVAMLLVFDVLVSRKIDLQSASDSNHGQEGVSSASSPVMPMMGFFIGMAMLVGISTIISGMSQEADSSANIITLELPQGRNEWHGPIPTNDNWHPEFNGAVTRISRYTNGAQNVYLYLGYYPSQTQGREVINEINRVFNKPHWKRKTIRPEKISYKGFPLLQERIINKSGQVREVWYWYTIANQVTNNPYYGKLLQILGLIRSEPAAYVTIIATDVGGKVDPTFILGSYMNDMREPLTKIMEDGR